MIRADKLFGQNFLTDPSLLAKIAHFLDDPTDQTVIEIGPGLGALTEAVLARVPKRMIVLEKDKRLTEVLVDLQARNKNFSFHLIDATKVDLRTLADSFLLIGNLPYNVSTVLLTRWLLSFAPFTQAVLMFQREVAERLLAVPNTKDYGPLSVLTQTLCTVQRGMNLSPSCFTPAPKVWSTVVILRPCPHPFTGDMLVRFNTFVRTSFGHRRKRVLKNMLSFGDLTGIFEKKGLLLDARAEDLTVAQYSDLFFDSGL